MFRKIISVFLLIIISYQSIGGTVYFHFKKKWIKEQIRNKEFAMSDCVSITIHSSNKKEIVWVEKHEFIFKQTMYDVIETVENKDKSITYICWPDREEKKLIQQICFTDFHPEKQPIKKCWVSNLKNDFIDTYSRIPFSPFENSILFLERNIVYDYTSIIPIFQPPKNL